MAELEARSNRLAHLLRAAGLKRLDHYAIFMENHPRYIECCAAGERSGLYYTAINSFLTAGELAYIVNNSLSRVLITSEAKREIALAALRRLPQGRTLSHCRWAGRRRRVCAISTMRPPNFPTPRSPTRSLGAAMLYSSGTTGRPEGRAPAAARPAAIADADPPRSRCQSCGDVDEGTDLSLACASLPRGALCRRLMERSASAGRSIVMERFDPEHFLALIEKHRVTHTQLVPTMFSRMLKLPEDTRRAYDLSSLEGRAPRRRALSGAGQTDDDRLVGTDHPRILRGDRRARPYHVRQRRIACASGYDRKVGFRRSARPRRRDAARSRRARPASSGSRPPRLSNISTIRRKRRRRTRPTAR